jgi:hypothetical protein
LFFINATTASGISISEKTVPFGMKLFKLKKEPKVLDVTIIPNIKKA